MIKKNAEGRVTDYEESDGFGFITTSDINKYRKSGNHDTVDIFFHVSDYPRPIPKEGDQVRFDIESNDKGFKAKNIVVIGKIDVQKKDQTFASNRHQWGKDT